MEKLNLIEDLFLFLLVYSSQLCKSTYTNDISSRLQIFKNTIQHYILILFLVFHNNF